MGLYEDLRTKVADVFRESWSERDGRKVPETDDVGLGNDGVKLDATVLYTDLNASTYLVDHYKRAFAAEIYKAFLYCAARIIRSHKGTLTSYDGDRIMGVFIGNSKNTSAAKAALGINYAVQRIINPELRKAYPKSTYTVEQTTGIDSSTILAVRTDIRGTNDLAWIGRAANHAAKLTSAGLGKPSIITKKAFRLHESAKYSKGRSMWNESYWPEMGRVVYTSTWYWSV